MFAARNDNCEYLKNWILLFYAYSGYKKNLKKVTEKNNDTFISLAG